MNARLRQIVSWWFIVQIVLPFTAPLQTLDVHDLFGTKSHRSTQTQPESTTTPTISESGAATAIVAVQSPAPVRTAEGFVVTIASASPVTMPRAFVLVSLPQFQQSVLRL